MYKELVIRSFTGGLIAGTIGASIYFSNNLTFLLPSVFGIICFLGIKECLSISTKLNVNTNKILTYINTLSLYSLLVLVFMGNENYKYLLPLFGLSLILTFILELFRIKGDAFTNIGYSLLPCFYIGIPLALLSYLLYPISGGSIHRELVFGLFLFIWCNDVFAYLIGMSFGKLFKNHNLFERLSPSKSWEGAIGGFICTCIMAIFWAKVDSSLAETLGINNNLFWIIVAMISSIFSIFGDLVESMLKRSAKIKDSSNILPGHGGILDRFDSVFIAVPAISCFLYICSIL